ncbi:MAG: CBS domain-containing protein [Rhodothalassiaceae bacterium]
MKIKDRPEFKTKLAPLTYSAQTKVSEAVKEMAERNIGAVIVVNDDFTVAGIVSERDLLRRLLGQKRDPETTTLGDIMTADVRVATAEDNLIDWLRQMSNQRFRHLPIVDDQGKVVAMMSQGDFVSYTWPELLYRLRENAQATLGPQYPIWLIVAAIILYLFLVLLLVL